MIVTFILQIAYAFINFLIGFLPVGSLPPQITTALTYFVGVINSFNFLFPIDTLITVLGISISFELAVVFFHFINWVYHKIRG